jgi:hypothetical protein
MINYDPHARIPLDPTLRADALRQGLHAIHVVCNEPDVKVSDQTGVSFLAFVPFVPRVGENIQLEDGNLCRVEAVWYKAVTDEGWTTLMPNVFAFRIPGKDEE